MSDRQPVPGPDVTTITSVGGTPALDKLAIRLEGEGVKTGIDLKAPNDASHSVRHDRNYLYRCVQAR